MSGKYSFHQQFADELVADFGREWVTDYARRVFQEHLEQMGLHKQEGQEIKVLWPAFPYTSMPPSETRWQKLIRWFHRWPKPEPYVIWNIMGYVRVQEDDPNA